VRDEVEEVSKQGEADGRGRGIGLG
jgi:hypothetical protein